MTFTDMIEKYHNFGTPINMAVLNGIHALPTRNLQKTSDPDIEGITGETFARDTLLRNAACARCPVGCNPIGFVRERFMGAMLSPCLHSSIRWKGRGSI